MAVEERTLASAADVARTLAAAVGADLADALARRPRASLIVSGGRSPIAFLEYLSETPLDWARTVVSLADERWVPPQHRDSNARLVAEHLLRHAAAAAQFIPLWNGASTPAAAIAERTAALATLPRPIDVLVLGMGEDGHTASLFPGAAGVDAALDPHGESLLAAIDPPAAPHPRLTLTLTALLDSRRIHLPIGGAVKQAVYRRARAQRDPAQWPIAAVLVQPTVPVRVYLSP